MTTVRGVLPNPLLDRAAVTPGAGSARSFHESLPGYAITPLVSAPLLARRLGVAAVHVKDESVRLGLPSFKILGASWATSGRWRPGRGSRSRRPAAWTGCGNSWTAAASYSWRRRTATTAGPSPGWLRCSA